MLAHLHLIEPSSVAGAAQCAGQAAPVSLRCVEGLVAAHQVQSSTAVGREGGKIKEQKGDTQPSLTSVGAVQMPPGTICSAGGASECRQGATEGDSAVPCTPWGGTPGMKASKTAFKMPQLSNASLPSAGVAGEVPPPCHLFPRNTLMGIGSVPPLRADGWDVPPGIRQVRGKSENHVASAHKTSPAQDIAALLDPSCCQSTEAAPASARPSIPHSTSASHNSHQPASAMAMLAELLSDMLWNDGVHVMLRSKSTDGPGMTRGPAALAAHAAGGMQDKFSGAALIACLVDSILIKSVLFCAICLGWTKYLWPMLACDELQATASPMTSVASRMVGWSVVAVGVAFFAFGALGATHIMSMQSMTTKMRLLHTLRLIMLSTAITIAHELLVLQAEVPFLPVLNVHSLFGAVTSSTAENFSKPVTLPILMLVLGLVRAHHFKATSDLSPAFANVVYGLMGYMAVSQALLVSMGSGWITTILPLELFAAFIEPLVLAAMLFSTNRLSSHHHLVSSATAVFVVGVAAHVPGAIMYMNSADITPATAEGVFATAYLFGASRLALGSFILPMVLFIGDLGVNQLEGQVASQTTRNELQMRFFRWLMHEQRSPLNDISIAMSLAQDAVAEAGEVAAAAPAGGSAKGEEDPAGLQAAAALLDFAQKAMKDSFSGVKRLQRVMHQVRDFGALVLTDTGHEGTTLAFELHDMLKRVSGQFHPLGARRGQRLLWRPLTIDPAMVDHGFACPREGPQGTVDAEGAPCAAVWVTADVVRLRNAIQTVVANALKFSARGSAVWVGSHVTLETGEQQAARLAAGAAAVRELTLDLDARGTCCKKEIVCAKAEAVWEKLSGGGTGLAAPEVWGDGSVKQYALWTTIVEDAGRGISPSLQEEMWNPFATLVPHEGEQNQGGSGLSLIIARAVVQRHGGSLHVFSEGAGKGTRVVMQVSVPVHQGRPDDSVVGTPSTIDAEISQWQSSGSGSGSEAADGSSVASGTTANSSEDATPGMGGGSGSTRSLSSGGSNPTLVRHGSNAGSWSPPSEGNEDGTDTLLQQMGGTGAAAAQGGSPSGKAHLRARSGSLPESVTAGSSDHAAPEEDDPAGPTPHAVAFNVDQAGEEGAVPKGALNPDVTIPLRILVVDDAKTTRSLFKRLLKRRTKAEVVHTAANGKEAVDAVADRGNSYYSLILMDKEMPVMDGYAAAAGIRALGYTRLMLGVTGNALLADVAEFKRKGVCRVLTKPVDAGVLAQWAEASTHYAGADAQADPHH